jgi:hypothetical protein
LCRRPRRLAIYDGKPLVPLSTQRFWRGKVNAMGDRSCGLALMDDRLTGISRISATPEARGLGLKEQSLSGCFGVLQGFCILPARAGLSPASFAPGDLGLDSPQTQVARAGRSAMLGTIGSGVRIASGCGRLHHLKQIRQRRLAHGEQSLLWPVQIDDDHQDRDKCQRKEQNGHGIAFPVCTAGNPHE